MYDDEEKGEEEEHEKFGESVRTEETREWDIK